MAAQFVFFDLDGTLLDHRSAQDRAAAQFWRDHRSALDPALELHAFLELWEARRHQYDEAYLRGELTFQGQRRARLRDLLRRPDLTDAEADTLFARHLEHYAAAWRLFDDVAACLDRVAARCGIGVITNGDAPHQRRKLAALGLTERCAPIVVSGELGRAKPDAAIFEHACALAGVPPERAVYVGDRLDTDARGAAAAGLTGVWLDRHDAGPAPGDVRRITSLDDLTV